METSGFFNAMENADGSYDRTYIAEQFAKFFSMFIGNGVFASPQNQLKVVAKENLTVVIQKGFAFIDGYWYYNDSDLEVDITPNATANKRVDGIFITLDKTERTITHTYEVGRTNRIVNGSVSELKIAEVTLEVGVAVLSDSKIKDTRADNNVCGFVTGIIDVIETDDLFLQFETQFNEWFNNLDNEGKSILNDFINESNALLESFTNDKDEALNNFSVEINEWFESIKGKMSEDDIAVSLQLQVDDLRTDTDKNTTSIGKLTEQVDLFDIIMSTDYTLPNSKKGGYRLQKLLGNTEQKKLSGKNLFNPATKSDDTMLTWAGGVTMVETGTVVSDYIPLNSITEIYSNYVFIPFFYNSAYSYLGCGVKLVQDGSASASASSSIVIPTNESIAYCRIVFRMSNNESVDMTTVDDIVISTTEDVAFEEYCGGVPSPNPNYSQSLSHTFDVVEMIQGFRSDLNGSFSSEYNFAITSKNKVPCKSGDVINVTTEITYKFIVYIFFSGDTFHSKKIVNYVNSASATVPDGADGFYFNILTESSETLTPNTVSKITLTINGKYVGCVKGHGKNFFNGVNVGYAVNSTGSTYVHSSFVTSDYIEVSTNTPYYFSNIGGLKAVTPISLYDEKRKYIDYLSVGYDHGSSGVQTITNEKVKYIRVCALVGEETQVEKGTVATDYKPYQETLAYILLNEPPRLGDFLFKDNDGLFKVERNVAEVVLDGSENWNVYNHAVGVYNTAISNCKPGFQTSKCSHFTNIDASWGGKVIAYSDNPNNTSKYFNTEFTTVDEWKAWLTENPITLMYQLATPTIEVLDVESQINLNKLETFDTVTYIEVDSRVQPLGVEGEYGTSQVAALALENANLRDLEAIFEKERNVVQRLNGVDLSSVNGYIKAYCVDCTDIPVFDEGTNEGFYEQWQNDYGINMERYTVLNESGYGNGIYTRVNNVSWQKVGADPVIELESRIQYVDVEFDGVVSTAIQITPPEGFSVHNSLIVGYDFIEEGNTNVYHDYVPATDLIDNEPFLANLNFTKNTSTEKFIIWSAQANSFGDPADVIQYSLVGTLRIYFLKYR